MVWSSCLGSWQTNFVLRPAPPSGHRKIPFQRSAYLDPDRSYVGGNQANYLANPSSCLSKSRLFLGLMGLSGAVGNHFDIA